MRSSNLNTGEVAFGSLALTLTPVKRLSPVLIVSLIAAFLALRRRDTPVEADLAWQPVDPE